MSGAEIGQAGYSMEKGADPQSRMPGPIPTGADAAVTKAEPLARAEKLSFDLERFSRLSSELAELLKSLSGQIRVSAEDLSRIQSEVDNKKRELNILHGIEKSAAALDRLVQDHRQQKENFERFMENQRTEWEEEKAKRLQEEKDSAENLRVRRQRDEEDYRQKWAAEKLRAQQKLEEELKVIQQQGLQKQQALERDCLERELALKQKELEWVQLIQELEQFMSKLARRTHAQAAEHPARPATSQDSGSMEAASRREPGPGLGVTYEERKSEPGDSAPQNGLNDEPKAAISSLKEILVSQGRRIENLNKG